MCLESIQVEMRLLKSQFHFLLITLPVKELVIVHDGLSQAGLLIFLRLGKQRINIVPCAKSELLFVLDKELIQCLMMDLSVSEKRLALPAPSHNADLDLLGFTLIYLLPDLHQSERKREPARFVACLERLKLKLELLDILGGVPSPEHVQQVLALLKEAWLLLLPLALPHLLPLQVPLGLLDQVPDPCLDLVLRCLLLLGIRLRRRKSPPVIPCFQGRRHLLIVCENLRLL